MRSIIFLILKSNKFYFLKESKDGVPILSERGGVGKMKSLEESRGVGFPVYTKTEIFEYKNKKYKTPKILLSGNHKKIREWRQEHSKYKVE